MKKIISATILSFIVFGCVPSPAKNNDMKQEIYIQNKSYEKMAAININALVRISQIVSGDDTPIDEMNEKVKKISRATLSIFDPKSVLINTFELKKVDTSSKGEVLKFTGGYQDIDTKANIFKLVFLTSDNSVIFEAETKITLKEKTIYDITGDLIQVSVKREDKTPETVKLNIEEKKPEQYAPNQFLFGMKEDFKEEEIKNLLLKNGIKVTNFKKGIIVNTVTFSEPSLAEALIIASKLKKFDYVEPNGIVSIIGL